MYHTGEIILVPYTFTPQWFLLCDGSEYEIQRYMALFSLLGTTHGGNGTTHFAVPTLTAPANMRYIICADGTFPGFY